MTKEQYYDVIRGPAITEKGTQISEHNQIFFNVSRSATKAEIKAAIEGLFGVKVKAVNTLVRKGKTKRFRGRAARLSDTKKAYVTLAEGERLDVTTGL